MKEKELEADAPTLSVRGARENNLKGIDLDLPHDALVVFKGVSGSGKSSLLYDTLFRESERRFLSSLPGRARQLATRMQAPAVDSIDGVRPAICVRQESFVANPRSTVATLSEIGDELRLLFARFGKRQCPQCQKDCTEHTSSFEKTQCTCGYELLPTTRSLFSFNTPQGTCPSCQGLGFEEKVVPVLLVKDPTRSLRDGALVPTTPTGYIVYSQVTPESMNEVCESHDFNIDIPWQDLSQEQKNVIFYGSKRVKVAFGKHSLESRMKWSGIKAKPRELGFYRGIVNVISETLAKKRNDNIARFTDTFPCSTCRGSRLSEQARHASFAGRTMQQWNALSIREFAKMVDSEDVLSVSAKSTSCELIRTRLLRKAETMIQLGLGHLPLSRASSTLSLGESRRLKLAAQIESELVGMSYFLDEPTAGLHPQEKTALTQLLLALRDRGNSVFVVEHDPVLISAADFIVEIGPGSGSQGGDVIFAGPPRTTDALAGASAQTPHGELRTSSRSFFTMHDVGEHNLKNVTVTLERNALNVVCGLSGAGKTSLVVQTLARRFDELNALHDWNFERVIIADQKPIGRTMRSNPATYTKMFDLIRDLFAQLDESKAEELTKGHFSFNKPGGRCEACEGAGSITIGLMDMPSLVTTCHACNGQRFNSTVNSIDWRGVTISEVLEMSVLDACELFGDQPKIARALRLMQDLNLGYVKLGQPAPTLSGGEAQRLKLVRELLKNTDAGSLIVIDEPGYGLHPKDVESLLSALKKCTDEGATVVVAENDSQFLRHADRIVELGSKTTNDGGELLFEGDFSDFERLDDSPSAQHLTHKTCQVSESKRTSHSRKDLASQLSEVTTNNLKSVNVTFPHQRLTAVTGLSGSGKSSLVFDSLGAEGKTRFAESFSPYLRREIRAHRSAELTDAQNIRATISIRARAPETHSKSTVGTRSELDRALRLMFARLHAGDETEWTASHFSFNNVLGACPTCEGSGLEKVCDLDALVPDKSYSLADGALSQTTGGKRLFELEGRLFAVVESIAKRHEIDLRTPLNSFSSGQISVLAQGDPNPLKVDWLSAKEKGEASWQFEATWPGINKLVEEEYAKKRTTKSAHLYRELLSDVTCRSCSGSRLRPEPSRLKVGPWSLQEWRAMDVATLTTFLENANSQLNDREQTICTHVFSQFEAPLRRLRLLGLSHLQIGRPTSSLSTGESQRLDLAIQLTSGFRDATYVLDEPGAGLHAQDKRALATLLKDLADQGNTVVVVEHDPQLIAAADHVIEVGPGSGSHGGEITFTGSPNKLLRGPSPDLLKEARAPRSAQPLVAQIRGAFANNLQDVHVDVRLGETLTLCGVSGAGKSTLLLNVLAPTLQKRSASACSEAHVSDELKDVILIHGRARGHGPFSTVATWVKVFDGIRKIFAAASDSLETKNFSPKDKVGRCSDCQGTGEKTLSLDFLPDARALCETCSGSRFDHKVADSIWQGMRYQEFLNTPVASLLEQLELPPRISKSLALLCDIGLGHLALGRRLDSTSSGENQRLGIARSLVDLRAQADGIVFLFDEPSRGLHAKDQDALLGVFRKLNDRGCGVVTTDHSLHMITQADRVLELGPGAANRGGRVIFEGRPRELKESESPTGIALREFLSLARTS